MNGKNQTLIEFGFRIRAAIRLLKTIPFSKSEREQTTDDRSGDLGYFE